VHSSGLSIPGCTAPGNTVPTPEFLGAVDPGVAGLGSPGFLDSSSLPVNWVQVEDNTEQACSQVAAVDRLL
jgi:hypothetical protein